MPDAGEAADGRVDGKLGEAGLLYVRTAGIVGRDQQPGIEIDVRGAGDVDAAVDTTVEIGTADGRRGVGTVPVIAAAQLGLHLVARPVRLRQQFRRHGVDLGGGTAACRVGRIGIVTADQFDCGIEIERAHMHAERCVRILFGGLALFRRLADRPKLDRRRAGRGRNGGLGAGVLQRRRRLVIGRANERSRCAGRKPQSAFAQLGRLLGGDGLAGVGGVEAGRAGARGRRHEPESRAQRQLLRPFELLKARVFFRCGVELGRQRVRIDQGLRADVRCRQHQAGSQQRAGAARRGRASMAMARHGLRNPSSLRAAAGRHREPGTKSTTSPPPTRSARTDRPQLPRRACPPAGGFWLMELRLLWLTSG